MFSKLRYLLATAPTARALFGPAAEAIAAPTYAAAPQVAASTPLWRLFTDYYKDRPARRALLVFDLVLAYAGGAVMFCLHALFLREGGPAISPYLHWALDSTFGFIGLILPLAVILPLAATVAAKYGTRPGGTAGRASGQVSMPVFTFVGGAAFALVTVAGPIMHDTFVARGTWIADRVTDIARHIGAASPAAVPPHEVSRVASMAAQFAVGLPTYTALFGLTIMLIRLTVRSRRRRSEQGRRRRGLLIG